MFRDRQKTLANTVVELAEGVKFRVINRISEGQYSDVYKVYSLKDNNFYAMKILRCLKRNTNAFQNLRNELSTYNKVGSQSPHIVKLLSKYEKKVDGGEIGDIEVYLIQELCPGGNLFDLIKQRSNHGQKGLSEGEVLHILSHIVRGLTSLHSQHPPIAHRDIKPENILLGSDNNWKICDFGSSTIQSYRNVNADNRHLIEDEIKKWTTRLYQAPEQIDLYQGFPISEKVDIFALGCIIFTLLFFRSPFDPEMSLEHSNARYVLPKQPMLSQSMTQLLKQTLTQDPEERISCLRLQKVIDVIQNQMYEYQPLDFPQFQNVQNNPQPMRSQFLNKATSFAENSSAYFQAFQINPLQDIQPPALINQQNFPVNPTHNEYQPRRNMADSSGQRGARGSSVQVRGSVRMVPQNQNICNQNPSNLKQSANQAGLEGLLGLPFASPKEQILTDIRNWVNSYCELSEKAPQELIFRKLTLTLHRRDIQEAKTFIQYLYCQNCIYSPIALRTLILCHKTQLYNPSINSSRYEQLLSETATRWRDVSGRGAVLAGDSWRSPQLSRLIYQYADYLLERIKIQQQFQFTINSAFVLHGEALNPNRTQVGSNPINEQFLFSLTRIWESLSNIEAYLFKERNNLFDIKLTLATNLLEEQFLLLSLLTHLNFTLKVLYRINQGSGRQNLDQIKLLIKQFDQHFSHCVANLRSFLEQVNKINDLAHLRKFLPIIPDNFINTQINTQVDLIAKEYLTRYGQQQKDVLKSILQVRRNIGGFYLPVNFEVYPNYERVCNYDYDLIIGNPGYRETLNSKLQENYFHDQRVLRENEKNARIQDVNGMAQSRSVKNLQEKSYKQQLEELEQFMQPLDTNELDQQNHDIVKSQDRVQQSQNPSQDKCDKTKEKPPLLPQQKIKLKSLKKGPSFIQHLKEQYGTNASISGSAIPGPSNAPTGQSKQSRIKIITTSKKQEMVAGQLSSSSQQQSQQKQQLQNQQSKAQNGLFQASEQTSHDHQHSYLPHHHQQQQRLQTTDEIVDDILTEVYGNQASSIPAGVENDQTQKTMVVHDLIGLCASTPRKDKAKMSDQQQLAEVFAMMNADHNGDDDRAAQLTTLGMQQQQQQDAEAPEDPYQMPLTQCVESSEHTRQKQGVLPQQQMDNMKTVQRSESTSLDISQTNNDIQFTQRPAMVMNHHKDHLANNFQYRSISNADLLHKLNILQQSKLSQVDKSPIIVSGNQSSSEHKHNPDDSNNYLNEADMNLYFQKNLNRIADQSIREGNRNCSLEESILEVQGLELDKERLIKEQEEEIARQSKLITQMEKAQKSAAEIAKQKKQYEELVLKFQQDRDLLQKIIAQLKKKLDQQQDERNRFLEQQKQTSSQMQKINEDRTKLLQINESLQKEIQELKEQQSAMQSSASAQDGSLSKNQSAAGSRQTPRSKNMTHTEIVDEILKKEFHKNQEHFRINVNDILVEKQIGAGASAEVYKGTYKEIDVAIKKLRFINNIGTEANTSDSQLNLTKEFQREIATLRQVNHTNLVNFMGASVDLNRGYVFILTEYCFGGTLFSLLHEKQQVILTNKQKFRMALDIARGMNALHIQEPPILHRDLKSLNLLLAEEVKASIDHVQVKVTDFGLSRSNKDMNTQIQSVSNPQMTGMAGTFHWMAPEVLQSQPYTHKADIYSYGIVLWEILARKPPFSGLKPLEIMFKVVQQNIRPDMSQIPNNAPVQLVEIMKRCWDVNPANRPDFLVIIKMLKSIENLIL